jgi:hypothetical protein
MQESTSLLPIVSTYTVQSPMKSKYYENATKLNTKTENTKIIEKHKNHKKHKKTKKTFFAQGALA